MIQVCDIGMGAAGVKVFREKQHFIDSYEVMTERAGTINPYLRPEIREFPVVKGLIGPMYNGVDSEFGGTIVRYETPRAHERYSS